jgi:serine/threonine-protein kinase RsbW
LIRLCVPGTLDYRDLAIRVVVAACKLIRATAVPDDFDNEVISAFGEAFNNVCIHGYRDRSPGEVEIEIDTYQDEIVIRMADTGESFDPTTMPPPSLGRPRESGMGIFIMRSFMEVTYEAGSPNVLCLRKRRAAEWCATNVHDALEAKRK